MRIKKTQTRSTDSPASTKGRGSVGSDSSGASKAEIVQKMAQTIAQKALTQRVVGELLGVSQPKVSLMLRGQLNSYTTDELSAYLKILNGQSASETPVTKTKAPKATKTLKTPAAAKATKASKAETSSDLPSKTAIVKQIGKEISRSGLSQRVVGNLLGISQPKISLMLRGQLNAYTAEQLSDYLNILSNQSESAPAAAKTGRRGPKPGPKAKDKSKAPKATKASTKATDSGDSSSKAEIVKRIDKEIKGKGISQRVVGELLGLSQPQVSLLLRGRYNSYSTEQLSNYLNTLSGQAPAVASTVGRRKNAKAAPAKAAPAKAPGRPAKIKAQPIASESFGGTTLDTPNWMLEEIAYLRQQLAITGSQRGDEQLLAEIDYLRRANAELQKKTERFDKMAALLQV